MIHTSPIVRARAVGLDEKQPEQIAVPALIDRLNDPDRVVRMTANDGLKERTQQDFGFVAWASPEERGQAITRWKGWWEKRRVEAGYPKDDALRKVSTRANRRRRIGENGDQGGTTPSWPATPQPPGQAPSPGQSGTVPGPTSLSEPQALQLK
jgi:hypothetical protein